MDCKTAQDLIGAYHERLLPLELRSEIEKHLTSCRQCAADERELKSVHDRLVKLFESNGLPTNFEQKVVDAVEARHAKPVLLRSWIKWASIAAVAIIGVTLIIASLGNGEITEPDVPVKTAEKKASIEEKNLPEKQVEMALKEQAIPEQAKKRLVLPKLQAPTEPSEFPAIAGMPGQVPQAQDEGSDAEKAVAENGHGKPSVLEGELLASPASRPGAANKRAERPERKRSELGPRRKPNRIPGAGKAGETERPERDELAERMRQRREGIEKDENKPVPAALAGRVAQMVINKGLSREDGRKAVRAMNELARQGVRPIHFITGLERMLNNMPESASFDEMLRKLIDALRNREGNGKTS